jgi:hypothetical protein
MLRFLKDRLLTAHIYFKRKEKGMPWNDDEHSIRGIEEAIRNDPKNQKRESHAKRIIEHYNKIKESSNVDIESLSEFSSRSSRESRSQAIAIAREDAGAVRVSPPTSLLQKVRGQLSWRKLQVDSDS